MPEHPNVGLVRKGYEAFAKGDMATLRELFSEDVVWHVSGNNPISGEYRGQDAVFAFFARTAELSGGTLRFDLHDVVANDEHAVALVRSTASRQGKQIDVREAQICHISNGKITEFWGFSEDQRLNDEFWS